MYVVGREAVEDVRVWPSLIKYVSEVFDRAGDAVRGLVGIAYGERNGCA
jgi:hypothetical protein